MCIYVYIYNICHICISVYVYLMCVYVYTYVYYLHSAFIAILFASIVMKLLPGQNWNRVCPIFSETHFTYGVNLPNCLCGRRAQLN